MKHRLEKLRRGIEQGADAAIITSQVNRRYFLGFDSSAGTLVVTREAAAFFIDSRYYEMATGQIRDCEVVLQDKLYEQLSHWLKANGAKTAAVESESMTLGAFSRLEKDLPKTELVSDEALSKAVAALRMVKDPDELNSIRAAQEITDKAFTHILGFIRPGVTELEIAVELEQFTRRLGSESPAFSYITAAGANSSKPHAQPSGYSVRAGDFVTMDFGATVNGYRSDMTRMVGVSFVSEKQREVYGLVLRAQQKGLEAVRAGAKCVLVDKAARDIIDATEYEGLFGHGLGHSLGLEIHEEPRFSTQTEAILPANAVMSVEPGVYISGEFGVRIEDIVVATADGCENLTKSEKGLIVL